MKQFALLLALGSLAGCQVGLSRAELTRYLADPGHGLAQIRQHGPLTLTCAYRPAELLQEPGAPPDSTYAANTYLALAFSVHGQPLETGLAGWPGQPAALSYLNGEVYQDACLVRRADTLAASGSLYPRQYGVGTASTVLLVFNCRPSSLRQGFRVVYRGGLLGRDTVSFPFAGAALQALPALRSQ